MKWVPLLALLAGSMFVGTPSDAQHAHVARFTTADGLPSSRVPDVVQDHYGFMWFATQEGLARYDGHEFRIYRHDPLDPGSIGGNWIEVLLVDRKGRLWIGTYEAGLSLYRPETDSFLRYQHDPGDPGSLANNRVTALHEDRAGGIWVGSGFGHVDRLDPATGTFEHHLPTVEGAGGAESHQAWEILEDSRGAVWIATGSTGGDVTDGALIRLDPRRRTTTRYLHRAGDPTTLVDSRVLSLFEEPSGRLWIGTRSGGLHRYDAVRDRMERVRYADGDVSNGWVFELRMLDQGHLLVSCVNVDLFSVPLSGGTAAPLLSPGQVGPNGAANVFAATSSLDGSLWLATLGAGVLRVVRGAPGFSAVPDVTFVRSILEDEGDGLWLASSQHGLVRLGVEGDPAGLHTARGEARAALAGEWVNALARDSAGYLWVGTNGGGLARLHPGSGELRRYRHHNGDPLGIPDDFVHAVARDRSDAIWLGTRSGVSRLNRQRTAFVRYPHPQLATGTWVGGPRRPHVFHVDAEGVLWIASGSVLEPGRGALLRYDGAGDSLEVVASGIVVSSLADDAQGRLWIGAERGLYLYDRAGDTLSHVLPAARLRSFPILQVLGDLRGHVWIVTSRAIARFDPALEALVEYGAADGYHDGHANLSALRREDGSFVFGGDAGLLVFDPARFDVSGVPPPIHITEVRVHDEPITRGIVVAGSTEAPLSLSHDQNDLTLEFAALHFRHPERNAYRVRLDPYEPDWNDVETGRSARYTSLQPGRYVFHVQAANSAGVWSERGASVAFVIRPPWWETWWFRLLAAAVLLSALALAYRYRVRQLLAVERMRLRIAGDLHDDIGAGLGSIALMSDLVRRRSAPGAAGGEQLEEIGRMAREMSRDLRELVWVIDPEHDRVEHLIAHMRQVTERLLAEIPYRFSAPPALEAGRLEMSFRRNVLLIYKEVLHNIVRHAGATRVEVELAERAGCLEVRVRDDGRGMDPDARHAGHGLRSLRRRAEEIGGKLNITSGPGLGTEVTLAAPIP